MRIFNNICFYALITCMLLFVNQQVVGVQLQFNRSPSRTIGMDGIMRFDPNIPRGDKLDTTDLFKDFGQACNELIQHGYETLVEKLRRISKDLSPTEDEMKKIGDILFKRGNYLEDSMQNDPEKDSVKVPSETSVLQKSVTEDKLSITKKASSLGNSVINKCKNLRTRKDSENSVHEALKSSDPKASETKRKQSINEITSILGEYLITKRNLLKQNIQKSSENCPRNFKKHDKINDPKASTTKDKQSTAAIASKLEDTFLSEEDYFRLPMEQKSENSVQEARKSNDLEASGTLGHQTLSKMKLKLGNSMIIHRMDFERLKKKVLEKSDQEASKSNSLDASKNHSQESSKGNSQEASKTNLLNDLKNRSRDPSKANVQEASKTNLLDALKNHSQEPSKANVQEASKPSAPAASKAEIAAIT